MHIPRFNLMERLQFVAVHQVNLADRIPRQFGRLKFDKNSSPVYEWIFPRAGHRKMEPYVCLA